MNREQHNERYNELAEEFLQRRQSGRCTVTVTIQDEDRSAAYELADAIVVQEILLAPDDIAGATGLSPGIIQIRATAPWGWQDRPGPGDRLARPQ